MLALFSEIFYSKTIKHANTKLPDTRVLCIQNVQT